MSEEAIKFLNGMYPKGPHCLTTISLGDDGSKKGTSTKTFYPVGEKVIKNRDTWINQYNGNENCYFHCNPVNGYLEKKASRKDILSVNYLHVDLDPEPDKNVKEEQARIEALLTKNLPNGVPVPTAVVFSGGGYQAYWKLAEPIKVDCDIEKAKDAALYNKQLEGIFNADSCHNIDRLMRLPGTWNIPDKKKRDKGRTKTLSKVLFADWTRVYELKLFAKAVKVQTKGKAKMDRNVKEAPSDIKRIEDLEEFIQGEGSKYQRLRMVINMGKITKEMPLFNPDREDDTRSSWLFEAICGMVRCKKTDEEIFSVITDPLFGISESVLEKTNYEDHAMRQIQNGRDFAEEPRLYEINSEYAFIDSITKIVHEVHDPALGYDELKFKTPTDFRHCFSNEEIEIGSKTISVGKNKDKKIEVPVMIKVGKWWLEHPDRNTFKGITFYPEKATPGHYNLWKGFGVKASATGSWEGFRHHIFTNICNGNQENYDYLIKWMARVVQFPALQGEVAIVLMGKKGTGKGFFANNFGRIFDRHYIAIVNSKHVVGNFNAILRDKVLVFADEAFFVGDRKSEPILKSLITEPTLVIEMKGIDPTSSRNCISLIIASNDDHVIRASVDERRYFALTVSETFKQDHDYFSNIKKELDNGGYEAMFHYLQNVDISDFNVRIPPKTEALHDQMRHSRDNIEEWWFNILQRGELLKGKAWPDWVKNEDLHDDYYEFSGKTRNTHPHMPGPLGRKIRKMAPSLGVSNQRIPPGHSGYGNAKREVGVSVPSIAVLRKDWENKFGREEWSEIIVEIEGDLLDKEYGGEL